MRELTCTRRGSTGKWESRKANTAAQLHKVRRLHLSRQQPCWVLQRMSQSSMPALLFWLWTPVQTWTLLLSPLMLRMALAQVLELVSALVPSGDWTHCQC
jgi:hypothetical protein